MEYKRSPLVACSDYYPELDDEKYEINLCNGEKFSQIEFALYSNRKSKMTADDLEKYYLQGF